MALLSKYDPTNGRQLLGLLEAADVSSALLNTTFHRLDGNTVTATAKLGTLNSFNLEFLRNNITLAKLNSNYEVEIPKYNAGAGSYLLRVGDSASTRSGILAHSINNAIVAISETVNSVYAEAYGSGFAAVYGLGASSGTIGVRAVGADDGYDLYAGNVDGASFFASRTKFGGSDTVGSAQLHAVANGNYPSLKITNYDDAQSAAVFEHRNAAGSTLLSYILKTGYAYFTAGVESGDDVIAADDLIAGGDLAVDGAGRISGILRVGHTSSAIAQADVRTTSLTIPALTARIPGTATQAIAEFYYGSTVYASIDAAGWGNFKGIVFDQTAVTTNDLDTGTIFLPDAAGTVEVYVAGVGFVWLAYWTRP